MRSTLVVGDREVTARASRSAAVRSKEGGSDGGPPIGGRPGGAIGALAVVGAGVVLFRPPRGGGADRNGGVAPRLPGLLPGETPPSVPGGRRPGGCWGPPS